MLKANGARINLEFEILGNCRLMVQFLFSSLFHCVIKTKYLRQFSLTRTWKPLTFEYILDHMMKIKKRNQYIYIRSKPIDEKNGNEM